MLIATFGGMNAVITTERLYLREMTAADAEHAFLLNNDPEVIRYTGDGPFATVEAAREFLVAYPDYRAHGFGRWAVVRRSDGAWLGWCGLKRHPAGEVDLGYRLLRAYWGQGYATEAGRACLELGFGRFALPIIIGQVDPMNTASVQVLKKLGMQYWKSGPGGHTHESDFYHVERQRAPLDPPSNT